ARAGCVVARSVAASSGIASSSRNSILRGLCYAYVELFRNVPVLLQLLMWYLLFTDILPPITEPFTLGGLAYLSKAGFSFPVPVWQMGQNLAVAGAVVGLVAAFAYRRWALRQFE